MSDKNKFFSICILSSVAFINAAYLSYQSYFVRFVDPEGLTSFCDVSKIFSCSDVLRHPLSQFFGISFPWIALIVYPVLFGIAYLGYKTANNFLGYAKRLAVLSFLGVLFNGFIVYREVNFIHAYCLLCLLCTLIILTIFGLSLSILHGKGEGLTSTG